MSTLGERSDIPLAFSGSQHEARLCTVHHRHHRAGTPPGGLRARNLYITFTKIIGGPGARSIVRAVTVCRIYSTNTAWARFG